MSDSSKFSDMTGAQQDSVAHFGDLANQILAGQIAARQQKQQPGLTDNSNSQIGSAPQLPEQRTFGAAPWQNQSPYRPAQINRAPWMPSENQPTLPIQQPNWRQTDTPPSGQAHWNPIVPPNMVQPNDRPSTEVIPTLHADQKPNQNDASAYPLDSADSKIYEDNKDSIVKIVGHGTDQPPNEVYTGSGFFVSNHGDIATAYHVISRLESITVTTSDGIEHPAHIETVRPSTDLAIIKMDTNETTKPVTLADSSNMLHSGDPTLTIGHPAGSPKEYLSPGKFVATDTARDLVTSKNIAGQNPNSILFSVSSNIQGGDSGAPTFDKDGKVVGIVSRGDEGSHGYMVSVNDLWPMMDKVSPPKQTTDYKPSDIPFKLNVGYDQAMYGLSSVLTASQFLNRSKFGLTSAAGQGIGAALALTELTQQDLPFLHVAFDHGTTREKISAVAEVGGDALMIGGAALNLVPRLRSIAPAVSLAGSLVKFGNGAAAFRNYD